MERNENGYSNFLFGNRNRTVTQNGSGRCPGTGEIWRGNGNMNGNMNGNVSGNMNGNANGNMNGNVSGNTATNNGGCLGSDSSHCSERQLAMVYSPFQCWRMLHSVDEALNRGTLFEELYKPLEDCQNG